MKEVIIEFYKLLFPDAPGEEPEEVSFKKALGSFLLIFVTIAVIAYFYTLDY